MSEHGRRTRRTLTAGLFALAALAAAGCDRNPVEPDGTAPESGAEQLYAKGAPKTSGASWVVSDLGLLPGDRAATAHDVNDEGYVVGTSEGVTGLGRGFLFDGTSMIPLTDAGVFSSAGAVSNSYPLLYAGGWIDDPGVGSRPVRWTIDTSVSPPSITHTFVSPSWGVVSGVNDSGDTAGREGATPMIWRAGGTETASSAPAGQAFESGTARDINNAGLVVLSFYGQDHDRGFLRLANGTLIELPPQPGDVSSYAAGISEVLVDGSVYVAGTTWRSENVFHPVRWTVDASSGGILSTWSISDNGSSGSTSDTGELAGAFENRWRDRPAIWTEAASVQLSLPRGISGGDARAISPDGRHAAGRGERAQGFRAVLWTRTR